MTGLLYITLREITNNKHRRKKGREKEEKGSTISKINGQKASDRTAQPRSIKIYLDNEKLT